MRDAHTDDGTRDRLMQAAAAIFAEKGYLAATIREICLQANANIAAVNYHFGGKQRLYAAVLTHFERRVQELYPLDARATDATPLERLRAYIHTTLLRILGDGDPIYAAHSKLLMLEILDPSPVLDAVTSEYLAPMVESLGAILKDILGQDAAPDYVRDCMGGIIGHCVFYATHRSLITRFHPEITYNEEGLERIVQTVLRFSLYGMLGRQHENDTDEHGRLGASDSNTLTA
jgi:AcrR family transcriptional regulator